LVLNPPKICAAITNDDLAAIDGVAPLVDLFEVRIDLIGAGWWKVAAHLKKPWIACNRRADEGDKWGDKESARIAELRAAVELGATIVDIELATQSVADLVKEIRGRAAYLVSYHNLKETPPLETLRQIVDRQLAEGADICKVVTTARTFADNLVVLQLVSEFSSSGNIVSFAMGAKGQLSRILCPLAGGYFTYASLGAGRESADGQLTVRDLREIYRMLGEK
jgi:3-dehydroquinate dehydratase-1